ncbi:MAG: SDR family NAD(P)-dependent oxidoreductase [Panacagrimonas sp.]
MPIVALVALVTGAGSGIGRATAMALAHAGHRVICADIKGAEAVAAALVAEGFPASGHVLDVRDSAAWTRLVEQILSAHGAVDILANVAGVVAPATDTVIDQTEADWQRVIDVDLKGVWLGMRAVLPQMIARGAGRIVNVASLAGLIGLPNLATYSAAKAGVIGLSRQAAMQYASKGVTINVVCPGLIDTPMLGEITDDMRVAFAAATPVGRMGRPEDIAASIVHFAGSGGAFITGQVLAIDGGWSAQ